MHQALSTVGGIAWLAPGARSDMPIRLIHISVTSPAMRSPRGKPAGGGSDVADAVARARFVRADEGGRWHLELPVETARAIAAYLLTPEVWLPADAIDIHEAIGAHR
jgi:hypothetical protein